MGKIKEWVLAHKGLTAALIGAVILLIYLSRRSSAASSSAAASAGGLSSSDYASIQNTEVQAATQLQAEQLAAQNQTNQLQAQLQADQLTAATQLGTAQLQQQVSLANIYANQNVQLQTVGAQKDVALATLQENTAVASDQASIELGLINILSGKGNTYNATVPSSMVTPATVSSAPAAQAAPGTTVQGGAAAGTTAEASNPVALLVTHPLLGPAAPGGTPAGYSEVPGVSYPAQNAPFAQDYTYPSESAAIDAGALVLGPGGHYVPANPGLQISY
jgi:hypothetical protein